MPGTETKWTEGPWEAILLENHGRYEVYSVMTRQSITGWGNVTQCEADAQLIAAAPDLYEALEPLEPLLEVILHTVQMPPARTEAFKQTLAKTRAALAKARGEKTDGQ